MCCPNLSNFFLLFYGFMCYVKIIILRLLLSIDRFCSKSRCPYTYFYRFYIVFLIIICGLRLCLLVNAFG